MAVEENKRIFSVLAENHPGVLLRVIGLFSRRAFNIESLVASETQSPQYSRISLVAAGDDATYKQITRQLLKLEEVVKVEMLEAENCSVSEVLLVKVSTSADSRSEVLLAVQAAGGRVLDIGETTITVEMSGCTAVVDRFVETMERFGIREMARSGVSALERGDNTIHDLVE